MSEQKKLEDAGTYQVAILEDPKFYQMPEKDGDKARMALQVRGFVNGGTNDGQYIDANLMFIRTIISGGKDQGKSMFDVQAAKCIELGMSAPFSPSKVSEMVGSTCEFVCEWEEYEGRDGQARKTLRVKYINTSSRSELSEDEAAGIWDALQADGINSEPLETGSTANDDLLDDNVPFGD